MIALLVLSALAITHEAECGRLKKEVNELSSSYFPDYSQSRNSVSQNSQGAVQQSQRQPSSVLNSVQAPGIATHNIGVSVSHSILGVPNALLSDSGASFLPDPRSQLTQDSRAPLSVESQPQRFAPTNGYNGELISLAGMYSALRRLSGRNAISNGLTLGKVNNLAYPEVNTNTNPQRVRLYPVPRPIPILRNNPAPEPEEVPQPVAENRPEQADVPQPVNVILSRPYLLAVGNPVQVNEDIPVYARVPRPEPVSVPRTYPVVKQVNIGAPVRYLNVNNLGASLYDFDSAADLGTSQSNSVTSSNELSSPSSSDSNSLVMSSGPNGGQNDQLYGGIYGSLGRESGSGSDNLYGGSSSGRGSYRGIGSSNSNYYY